MEDEYKAVCALFNSAAFDDLEWPWTPISRSQYSLKANILQTCIRSTPCLVLGYGFRDRRIEWRYLRFNKIQDGSWRPSWNDGAVARNPCVSWAFLCVDDDVDDDDVDIRKLCTGRNQWLSVLNYCLEWDKWVLTNLSHEWQQFNTLIPWSHELCRLWCTRTFTTRYTT